MFKLELEYNKLKSSDFKLLSREDFKKEVFRRDDGLCVICKNDAVDAHHIFDRKLFVEEYELGGYFLQNGVSVCKKCHYKCETTEYDIPLILYKIYNDTKVDIIYPSILNLDELYDKWGNSIYFEDGYWWRNIGPLYNDDGCQKALKMFMYEFKENDIEGLKE